MSRNKILLVDDEEDIRLVLSMALEDMGYDVLAAENGKEGLRLFKEFHPPIVITDIKMPDIDGVDLLRKIKEDDPEAEVIMITGHGDMEVAIQSFQSEATDFITKPINVEDLESALTKVHQKIAAREKLQEYTRSLEGLVHEKSEKLADLQRVVEKGGEPQALEVVERFRSLFSDLPCHVAVMDEHLALTAINRKFRQEFGDREGEFCYHVLKRMESPCSDCPVQTTFFTGESQEGEAEITTLDGQLRDVLVWTSPIRTAGGTLSHVLTLYTDMAQIQKVQDHLSSPGADGRFHLPLALRDCLQALMGACTSLIQGFARKIRNKSGRVLDVVKQMVGRIRNMVLDVLLFSKDRGSEDGTHTGCGFCRGCGKWYPTTGPRKRHRVCHGMP